MKPAMLRVAVLAALAIGPAARACPVCSEETGTQVRAGIFDERFGENLLITALPFAVFLGITAAIACGGPRSPAPTPDHEHDRSIPNARGARR